MLHLYYSNRHERLAATLLERLHQEQIGVFEREIIVVPNQLMASWLSLRIADVLGICANIDFPLPGRFIWESFRSLIDLPKKSGFEADILVWRIFSLLKNCQNDAGFGAVRHYLESGDTLKMFELAEQLADNFDQYLVYRPDWIRDWQSKDRRHWQAQIWHSLTEKQINGHWVDSQQAFLSALEQPEAGNKLPKRVFIYGLSALSPAYIDVLEKLAEKTEIHLFVLNPCQESWGEQKSAKATIHSGSDSFVEIDQTLLAAMGRKGRDFVDSLQDCNALQIDAYEPSGHTGLLGMLQNDILHLRTPERSKMPASCFEPDDRSVCVHVCHGPVRELEVLHDQLLSRFESDPELVPEDIIVLLPDVDVYAPYIQAVFGTVQGRKHIPFSIADRTRTVDSESIDAFLTILEITETRFTSESVLSILACPSVLQRFSILESDLPRIRQWVQMAAIRWGIDADHRHQQHLPQVSEYSWRWGLQRLLLGYAMNEGDFDIAGLVPAARIEGSNALITGRLISFCENLFELHASLQHQKTAAQWRVCLGQLLEQFFVDDDDLNPIRQVLEKLEQDTDISKLDSLLPLTVIRHWLQRHILTGSGGGQYGRGGVLFSRLQCECAIPRNIVCLLGMNEGHFPRRQKRSALNLMLEKPRAGDRNPRADDRYAFLEALLSARQQLYISYVGKDSRENSVIPPSNLVSELLEYINHSFNYELAETASDVLVTEHPLQAFSQKYYQSDSKLFSYNPEYFSDKETPSEIIRNFYQTDSLPMQEVREDINLAELKSFLRHPARHFLRQKLGLGLSDYFSELADTEPFELEAADSRRIRVSWVSDVLQGQSLEQQIKLSRYRGELPPGRAGELQVKQLEKSTREMLQRLKIMGIDSPPQQVSLDLDFGTFRIQGCVGNIWPVGHCEYRLSDKLYAADWIGFWLDQCLLQFADSQIESRLVNEKKCWKLSNIPDVKQEILSIVNLYQRSQHSLLPLFPKSAWAFSASLDKYKNEEKALLAAEKCWLGDGGKWSYPESQDSWLRQIYGGDNVLDESFVELAKTLFSPVLQYRKDN